MSYIKSYSRQIILSLIEILIGYFIITLLYYNNIITSNYFKTIEISFILVIIFFNSCLLGKKSNIKRIICGISYALFYIITSLISSLMFKEFKFRLFLYYLIIILISILGCFFSKKKR